MSEIEIEASAEIPEGEKKDSVVQVGGMYVASYLFSPKETVPVTVEDIGELFKAMELRLGNEVFDRLPERVRRHFVVHHRDGSVKRYGERQF